MIEDDEIRIERVTSWLPQDVRLVVARSPGRAISTLKIDGPTTYAGLMLDHDLQQLAIVAEEASLSGSDLIRLVVDRVDHDVPVLVHSMNRARGPVMVAGLKNAGFYVTYIPFSEMEERHFRAWLNHVIELWEDSE